MPNNSMNRVLKGTSGAGIFTSFVSYLYHNPPIIPIKHYNTYRYETPINKENKGHLY